MSKQNEISGTYDFNLLDFSKQGQVRSVLQKTAVVALVINVLALGYLWVYGSGGKDWLTEYNLALYWTVTTLTTVGYGDITPSDNFSRIYTMFVMLAGVGFYGYVIGQIAQYFVSKDRRFEQTKEKLEALTSFFRHYEIPAPLQEQTFSFVQHLLDQSSVEEEETILKSLPQALQSELRIHMNIKPLASVSLFRGCSYECLADTAKQLEHVFYGPGERVFSKGDVGSDMYLIGHGKMLVHEGSRKIAELGYGECFGEMALIEEGVRGADITSQNYCDLFRLGKEEFAELVARHNDLADNVANLIQRRRAG